MPQRFWSGKRVLVTGHTGFKGSWLSLWLLESGAQVAGYALDPPSEPCLFELLGLAAHMETHRGDVRDLDRLRSTFTAQRPEIVFHLAAQSLVRPSYADPVRTFATNVMGTVHLLECARHAGQVRAVINVTSDKCYENREWPWGYRESDPMGGHDPYSSSKGCAELVTAAYRRSFLNGELSGSGPTLLASARAGNVIGGGDWASERLIPDVLRALSRGAVPEIRNPAATRPWQHVLEPLSGYLMLAERLYRGEARFADAWNFGPAESEVKSVAWITEHLAALWGRGGSWERSATSPLHEAHGLKLDSSKARSELAWRPKLALSDTLRWTVDWYRAHEEGAAVRAMTEAQIARYQALEIPA